MHHVPCSRISRVWATLSLGLVLGVILGTTSADAAPLTYTYYGNVTFKYSGVNNLPAPFNNPNIVIGSPVALSYTFESATPDVAPGGANGSYPAVSQIVFTVGPASQTWNFTSPLASLLVFNDMALPNNVISDRYRLNAFNLGPGYDFLSFQLDDYSNSVFNSDALPLTQPPASAFTNSFGQFEASGFIPGYLNFNLTAVPEPAALAALSLALPLVRRRRA